MIPLLAGWSAVPFRVMVALQIVAGLEEMVIAVLVPAHVGEMATVWHALRLRRADRASLNHTEQTARPVEHTR
jgi:hypothetical protein